MLFGKITVFCEKRIIEYPDVSRNFGQVRKCLPTAGNARILASNLNHKVLRPFSALEPFSSSNKHLLLSCELLWYRSTDVLQALVDTLSGAGYDEVRFAITFRPVDEYLLSCFLQDVKVSKVNINAITADEYVRKELAKDGACKKLNWLSVVQTLHALVGAEAVSVFWYPYVKQRGSRGLIEAYFEWLGLGSSKIQMATTAINPSLSCEALCVLQHLHIFDQDKVKAKKFANAFIYALNQKNLLKNRPELSHEFRRLIAEQTAPMIEAMLAEYAPNQLYEPAVIHEVQSGELNHVDENILVKTWIVADKVLETL